MSSINLDTMKHLLEEFADKEALAQEEIKVVEEQIEELKQRIVSCHTQLKLISEDRIKIGEMTERYAKDSNFALSDTSATSVKTKSAVSSKSGKSKASTADTNPKLPSFFDETPAPSKATTKSDAAPKAEVSKEASEEPAEDPVKSINDALRGLFH